MKTEIGLLCSVLTLSSCATPWNTVDREAVILPDVTVTSGGHCESSAMVNALRYAGYDVSECMVIGGGAAPSFVYLKGTFPFVGGRCTDMRELFVAVAGLDWHDAVPEGKDGDWSEIRSLLVRGIPVVLRVDMRFLPYRYGGKYGSKYMSFGGHYVTLFGIDPGAGMAYVSDTEYVGLQTVKLSDLHRARTSDTKIFPTHGEYSWMESPSGMASSTGGASGDRVMAALDADALVLASFRALCRNYETGALDGLSRYGHDLESIESYSRQKFLLPAVFDYMYGNIEKHGTGGASFRVPYRDFLLWAAENSSFAAEASALVPYIDECIASWHELSAACRALSPEIKGMNAASRAAEYRKLAAVSQTLYEREKKFYTELKKISLEMTGA